MRQCSECGEEVSREDQYCSGCGSDLSKPGAVTLDIESEELKDHLQQIDNFGFERFVADLWSEMGWDTEVTTASTDAGIDVVAEKERPYQQKQLIQAKRYTSDNKVSSSDVQQYSALKQQEPGVDAAVIVTTSSFSSDAAERGRDLNVKLIDGDHLVDLIDDLDAYDTVEKYVDFQQEEENMVSLQWEEEPVSESPTEEIESTVEEFSPSETVDEQSGGRAKLDVPDTVWHKGVMVGTAGWIIILFGINIIPEAVGGFTILISQILLPLSIYLDTEKFGENVDWPRYRWAYLLSSALIPVFAFIPGLIYLWKRKQLAQEGKTEESERERTDSVEPTKEHEFDGEPESIVE